VPKYLAILPFTVLCVAASPASAQWTNRYPRLQGYSHHVYLEGYELPTLNQGPTSPALSPDGTRVAFSARGWIWILDITSGVATRVTDGGNMDFRPSWFPDGTRLAFVRDDTRDTWIVVRDLDSGDETVINTPAIDLDPVFVPGRNAVVFGSASAGQFDLWTHDLATGENSRLTARGGIELKPTVSANGETLVYVHKGGGDRVGVQLHGGLHRLLAGGLPQLGADPHRGLAQRARLP